MDRWRFAAKHGWASLTGWLRLLVKQPTFAWRLLRARTRYFIRRDLAEPLVAPGGFRIDTPDTLIAYWSMFVERELHDRLWADAVRAAPAPLIVDVGANAGVFSFYVHTLQPGCEFICFEPLPVMAGRIRELAERAGMRLVCHERAVSNQRGQAFLASPHGYEGISRLVPQGATAPNALEVETVTLDEMLNGRAPRLIKIDVEGFECEVLEGGRAVVGQADYLIIEAQSTEHLARIVATLGDLWQRKQLGSSDYLFYRKTAATA